LSKKEVSLASLAQSGLRSLEKYTLSQNPIDKLLVCNALLLMINIAFLFAGNYLKNFETISFIIYFLFGALFGAIILLGYVKILDLIKKVINNNYFAFNFSVAVLLISATFGLIGNILVQPIYLNYCLYGVITQLLGLLFFGLVIKLPVQEELAKKQNNVLISLFWNILDKISIVSGVISLIIFIINFFL